VENEMMKNRDSLKPERSEGDVNISAHRQNWGRENIDRETRKLLDEDARYFLHQSLSTPCLDVLKSCDGSEIVNLQDRAILDFHGNSVHQVGYRNESVVQAIKDQMESLPFCPRRYTNLPAIQLAKKLTSLAPGNLNKVLFAPGGTTAIGMALKLARVATGRFKTISWWDSFHGASLDAISIGGEALFRSGMGPLLPGAFHVPPPSAYRPAFGSKDDNAMQSPEYVDYVMKHEGDIAAFIAEPIRCTSVIIPPKEYWRQIREICNKHGALLIFDEIPLCLGRTGKMFACEHFGVIPDILCIGKGLGGGIFPMAAMIAREDLDIAEDKALGHYTHEKNPVGCVAALSTIQYIEDERLIQRSASLGKQTLDRLWEIAENYPIIGDIRGTGLLMGIELVKDRVSKEPATDEAERVMYTALAKGLSFKISMGNILTLVPPLTISREEMDRAVEILVECFEEQN
jgi:4-aminobutyrate aminotransferase